jgi:TolB protein
MRLLFSLFASVMIAWFDSQAEKLFKKITQEQINQFQILDISNLTGRLFFTAKIDGYDRILVLDIQSHKIRAIIDEPSNNNWPQSSPNGRFLAFVSDRTKEKKIFVADWDGGNQRQITSQAGPVDHPSWLANNLELIYTLQEGKNTNIYQIDVATNLAKQLTTFKGRNSTPIISSDGKRLFYSTDRFWPGWDICVFSIQDQTELCPLSGVISYCRPALSNSGQMLAYSSGALDRISISTLNLTTNSSSRITKSSGKAYDAVFSPDDEYIAFTSDSQKSGIFSLYLTNKNGDVAPLIKAPFSIRYISWSKVSNMELEAERARQLQ